MLVLLAGRVRSWRQSLLIVQPDTLLRWHRDLFRRFWRRTSRTTRPAHRPPITPETIALIGEMAAANRTWGAERIRGELLKLQIRVAKATMQEYLRGARPLRRSGQNWAAERIGHCMRTTCYPSATSGMATMAASPTTRMRTRLQTARWCMCQPKGWCCHVGRRR